MTAHIGKYKYLVVALLASAIQSQSPTAAAAHVSRCSDGGDTQIYTDGSCRALGAEAVPMSAQLLRGLIDSGGMDGQIPPTTSAPAYNAMQSRLAHPGAASCSRTPAELAAALRASLGSGDVNQLATAYDWTGVSAAAAKPMMHRLERMSRLPLTSGYYFNANDGVVQLVQGSSTVSEFPVTRRAGCLFLQF